MKSRSAAAAATTAAAAVFCLWTCIVSISVDSFQIERLPYTLARPSRQQQHVAVSMIKGNNNNKNGNNDEDFMRWAKQSRSASFSDNKVELLRPLGLILNQDEQGNVYVETVAPKGNAARSGKVNLERTNHIHMCMICSRRMRAIHGYFALLAKFCQIWYPHISMQHCPLELLLLMFLIHCSILFTIHTHYRSRRATLSPCAARPLETTCGVVAAWV
jgi:hypothetical protein